MSGSTLPRVGFLGLGVMGYPMAGHLARSGAAGSVIVFNRTSSKADAFLSEMGNGASAAGSGPTAACAVEASRDPAEVASRCDVLFSILGDPSDVDACVRRVCLPAMRRGSTIVEMTTSTPTLAREIAEDASRLGVGAVDAPVSGGDIGARAGTLSVMAGGAAADLAAARPLLESFSKTITHVGEAPGSGQHAKAMNQAVIAGAMIGVCEGLAYARRTGLDVATAFDAIRGGAAGSFSLDAYAPRVLKGDMDPGFKVKHFVKDLGICLDEARAVGLELRGVELAKAMYEELLRESETSGELGTQSLIRAIDRVQQ